MPFDIIGQRFFSIQRASGSQEYTLDALLPPTPRYSQHGIDEHNTTH